MLFSKKRSFWREKSEKQIQVGNQDVFFAKGATCWLGLWLDSALTLVEDR